ncbi:MAG: hypothetical protein ATN34_05510 [Epulopiscium sp. Nele67-Bin002]|nr:MAG: hypothetical protein ATN34_05510 [Epulopiscium sp. Nele67-Bin002]
MTIQEIINAIDGICLNPDKIGNTLIKDIFTDSRKSLTDGLFVPLVGESFDGHNYINQVYDKGALATLSSNKKIVDDRLITIYVPDTKVALLALAKYYSRKFERCVVAITGSVGKTTTKDMIATVLAQKLKVHKTEGNFNNEIGLPLTLFKVKPDDDVSVLEMGMNHFGEISNLTLTAEPDIAIITNIGTSHIENLGSREGILNAKLEILEGLKSDGIVLINGDEPLLTQAKGNNIWVTYGLNPSNDYYATDITYASTYVEAIFYSPLALFKLRVPAPGEHMVKNALAAIAVGELLGLTTTEIMDGIKSYKTGKMRMEITELPNQITIIDDTYNASVDSMVAALKVLENIETNSRKIAILGDMFELGIYSDKLHEEVGEVANEMNIDCVYTIGNYAQKINQGVTTCESEHFNTKELCIEQLPRIIRPGDVVLIKASRGMHLEQVVEAIGKVRY